MIKKLLHLVSALRIQLSSLVQTRTWSAKKLHDLETLNSIRANQINDLTGQVNSLTGQVNSLTGQVNSLTGQVNTDFVKLSKLKRQREGLDALYGGNLPKTLENENNILHRILTDQPHSVEEAISYLNDITIIGKNLADGFYKKKLVILTTLEKSGSTTWEILIRELLRLNGIAHEIGPQRTLKYGPFAFIGDLFPTVLMYARDGGVLRGVLRPFVRNVQLLKEFGCLNVILFRHPADRLVARYSDPSPDMIVVDQTEWILEPQYMIRKDQLSQSPAEIDTSLLNLIRSGYLLDTLEWMTNWINLRSSKNSLIIPYESAIGEGEYGLFLEKISDHLFAAPLTDEFLEYCKSVTANYRTVHQPGDVAGRSYPKGYSGKVGVRYDYFTATTIAEYNHVVEGFLNINPNAKALLDYYPDLIL
ncbi:hypothetical protein OAQ35_04040 [Litorivicinus sp.]|nr:hypothetical protein [Litorivicinus sp.]